MVPLIPQVRKLTLYTILVRNERFYIAASNFDEATRIAHLARPEQEIISLEIWQDNRPVYAL